MSAPSSSSSRNVRFEQTRWSLVLRSVDDASSGVRGRAMEELCRAYWYPLYAFLRSSGNALHDAQDLTQGFFASLADGRLLSVAAAEKGRFRTLLLLGLKRFAANAAAAERAWKRGGRTEIVPLDEAMAEERWQADAAGMAEPEAAYDKAWAMAAVDSAVERLREEYAASDRGALCEALAPRLTGREEGERLADVAARLGMTEAAVKMALSRMRRVFGHALRAVVADTVNDASEIQEELRYLLSQFQ